ncbi:ligase-associated DNA damage response endonuclease PdeM [Polymorphobacter fuscus]|uniref:Ligase-associated DNA damage response endonuclease PdeM n=1 Tax=Sandarakinorhabdus fusca TaxID=1439888 RepID=A0A7C9GR68_9SPHN|nr:ligase-associated DNA damage response endonuclease PdeM [Polymorphobacter fuscus]KAB7644943.1 ligase-associated DNA damage response endonuclease PdeM [Polymorphobacter fuscus]MQT18230.1 ligase-associated DNA damage response endonuclease PdeM [Polymorphobacter fuscus]NJC09553.1 hypothetical protein [Polymorphobacter fuscus]
MDVALSFGGETLQPLPCGGLYWPAQSTLIVADLHFEKSSAFARRGWLLPPYDSAETLRLLIDALEATGAARVICLGDSFHDRGGPDRLPAGPRAALQALAASLDWLWITGNHDDSAGASLGGRVMAEARIGGLTLRHEADPADGVPELSGHFHPKVAVRIRGRRITRRAFAMSATKMILPAYGAYAGGLDIADPAITGVMRGPVTAVLAEGGRLLRFPVWTPPGGAVAAA